MSLHVKDKGRNLRILKTKY